MIRRMLILLALSLSAWSTAAYAQTTQICDTEPVPAGQVIIKRFHSHPCLGPPTGGPASSMHTWLVKPPSSPEPVVCIESPRPPGWVITKVWTTSDCFSTVTWSSTWATFTIEQPVSPMAICSQSPVPEGYVITSVINSNDCRHLSGSAVASTFNIKIPTAAQENVCLNSPVPSNYQKSTQFYSASCVYSGSPPSYNARIILKI